MQIGVGHAEMIESGANEKRAQNGAGRVKHDGRRNLVFTLCGAAQNDQNDVDDAARKTRILQPTFVVVEVAVKKKSGQTTHRANGEEQKTQTDGGHGAPDVNAAARWHGGFGRRKTGRVEFGRRGRRRRVLADFRDFGRFGLRPGQNRAASATFGGQFRVLGVAGGAQTDIFGQIAHFVARFSKNYARRLSTVLKTQRDSDALEGN